MWVMLFEPSASGIGRVELYSVRDSPTNVHAKPPQARQTDKRVVRLCDCLSIALAQEEVCPPECSAFLLNTTKRSYTLASDACSDWVVALSQVAFQREPAGPDTGAPRSQGAEKISMEDNDLYLSWKTASYDITIQPTEASRRCNLRGDFLLRPNTDALLLLDLHTAQTLHCWPYHLLRKFGYIKGGFSIEAGRRCSSGEGQFTFLSPLGPQIHRAVEEAIAQHCQEDTKPPPMTSTPPPESPIPSGPQDTTGFLSDNPDRLPSSYQPPRYSPTPSPLLEELPESCDELYATIDTSCTEDTGPLRIQSLSEFNLPWEGDEEDGERCFSLDSLSLDDLDLNSDYYNLRTCVRAKMETQPFTERDSSTSECIYTIVSNPQPQNQSQTQLEPQPISCSVPQPRSQLQPQLDLQSPARPMPRLRAKPKSHFIPLSQPKPQPQGEDTWWKGEDEVRHPSPTINPTEIPGTFRQKLSDILSKDLAKLHPPMASAGMDPPTFYHY